MQSKRHTINEVVTTSIVKLVIVSAAQITYFKCILQKDITFTENIGWAVLAFVLSLGIGYVLRRFFNKKTTR